MDSLTEIGIDARWMPGPGLRLGWELTRGQEVVADYAHVNSARRRLARGHVLGRPWCLSISTRAPQLLETDYVFAASCDADATPLATFVLRGFELHSGSGGDYIFRWKPGTSVWELVTRDGAQVLSFEEPGSVARAVGVPLHFGEAAPQTSELDWLVLVSWAFYERTVLSGGV